MQDRPSPAELVRAVAIFLQSTIMPQSVGRVAFETRIAINALELVARQLILADEAHTAERLRLEQLLGRTGTLTDLNRDLCTRIANGRIAETNALLVQHLWATTLEKLAVDQPSYAAYREELQRTRGPEHGLQSSA
jgi:hypothetical protein